MRNFFNFEFMRPLILPALPMIARAIFASSLGLFFWKSMFTKFDGLSLSIGAYAQIFPKSFEAVGYDPSQLSFAHHIIAYLGSISELILPILIIIGLFTRLSAIAMIGFIAVLSVVDIYGHGIATGMFFDGDPYGIIADQRLYWVGNLLVIIALGGGALSLDRIFGITDKD